MNLLHMTGPHNWRQSYEAAVLETDREQLMARIIAAQNAINARLRELKGDGGGPSEERKALMDAMNGLRSLREEVS